jgi:hypothetical protein
MASHEEIAEQQKRLTTNRRTLAHYLGQQASLGAAFAPPAVANGIDEARSNIRRIKRILRGWNVRVEDHPDDGDEPQQDAAAQPAQAAVSATVTALDRVRLRQMLIDYFNDDELRDLCFDLKIDYDSLPATGKAGKARELVAFAERRGRFQELVGHIHTVRPDIPQI